MNVVRSALISSVLFAATLFRSSEASAHDNATRAGIYMIHLNSDISGRGTCIQLGGATTAPGQSLPPLSSGAWASLAVSNPLYRQLTALLMLDYAGTKTCDVVTDPSAATPHMENVIALAECF